MICISARVVSPESRYAHAVWQGGCKAIRTARKDSYRFATEVIPHLRDIWADQPDLWTPAVSQQRVAEAAAARPVGIGG